MNYAPDKKTYKQRGVYALFTLYIIAKFVPFDNALYQYLAVIMLMIGLFFITSRINQDGALFCAFFLIQSLIGGLSRGDGFNEYASAGIILVSWLCFWSVCAHIRLGTCYIEKLFRFLIGLVFIAIIYNLIINYSILTSVFRLQLSLSTIKSTFISFFGNSNNFGFYLYVALCLLVFLQRKRSSTIQLAAIVIVAVSLFFTLSRTAIMSALLFIAIFILLEKRSQRTLILFSGLIIIVMYLFISTLLPQNNIISEYFLRSESGLGERDLIWKYGWQQFLERPILGYGFGNSNILYIGKWNKTLQWHNGYLDVLLSGGVLYLILYLASFLKLFKVYLKIGKQNHQAGNLYISFLISFMLYSFFEDVTLYGVYPLSCVITVLLVAIPLMHFKQIAEMPENEL